jgi:dethiobiotin synthetase
VSSRGFFVSGTDTGVGKTLFACALVRAMRRRGLDVGVMKPIETGVGAQGPLDAQALRDAAQSHADLDEICPQRFALPAAPTVAAASEGRSVALDAIRAAFARLRRRHAWLVVEGAGGLLVPAAPDFSMADLVAELELPLLIVCRASLGTINHTLLTLEAARARHLTVAGVVISHSEGVLSAADQANLQALREDLGTALLGELPALREGESPDESRFDLDALLERGAPRSGVPPARQSGSAARAG